MERISPPAEDRVHSGSASQRPCAGPASFQSDSQRKLFFSVPRPAACSLSLSTMCLAGYGLHSKMTDDSGGLDGGEGGSAQSFQDSWQGERQGGK